MIPVFLRQSALKLYEAGTKRQILARFDELNRSQWLGYDALKSLQQEKLQRLVDYAYQYVPHYRQSFDRVGFKPSALHQNPGSFQKIPIITKQQIRANTNEFITTDPALRKTLLRNSTSGSSGEPFIFWQDYNYKDYFMADLLRHLTWCGWSLGEPHAYLWGQSLEKSPLHRLRALSMDFTYNRFTANAYILTAEKLEALVKKIRRYQPRLLFGYPSSLYVFAQFIQEKRLGDIRFEAIYSSGEILYPQQRHLIEETFGCKVFDRYSTLEAGGIACECDQHTGLHISIENCYVEILRDGVPVEDGQPGEMVVTNLNNYGFPLIRYRLADIVTKSSRRHCPCGRQSPMLESVQGRAVDMFRTADGRTVWGDFDSTIFEVEGIQQFQIVQKSPELLIIRIVKDDTFQDIQLETIQRIAKKTMGNQLTVQFEFLDHIPTLESGKYRYALSEIGHSEPPGHIAN